MSIIKSAHFLFYFKTQSESIISLAVLAIAICSTHHLSSDYVTESIVVYKALCVVSHPRVLLNCIKHHKCSKARRFTATELSILPLMRTSSSSSSSVPKVAVRIKLFHKLDKRQASNGLALVLPKIFNVLSHTATRSKSCEGKHSWTKRV